LGIRQLLGTIRQLRCDRTTTGDTHQPSTCGRTIHNVDYGHLEPNNGLPQPALDGAHIPRQAAISL
jgi:hypothetical protein